MARGGAHAFLQRLTDAIGGRVTGSPESRAAANLLVGTLREAGYEDAHFEEYALESRWQRRRSYWQRPPSCEPFRSPEPAEERNVVVDIKGTMADDVMLTRPFAP